MSPEGELDGNPIETSNSDTPEEVQVSSITLEESNTTEAEPEEDSQE